MPLNRRMLLAIALSLRLTICYMVLGAGRVLSLVSSEGGRLRMPVLGTVALRNVETGATEKAKRRAKELLELSEAYKDDVSAARAIHKGNLVLGRLTLRDGDIAAAKDYLLRAVSFEDSPAPSSLAPNMSLAKELLEAGENEVVLEYFALCDGFWDMGSDYLKYWAETVRQGQMPSFGPSLHY